jgi:hypothetical protein
VGRITAFAGGLGCFVGQPDKANLDRQAASLGGS